MLIGSSAFDVLHLAFDVLCQYIEGCGFHLTLVKAQCIRSYGGLKALLHMVGSNIQMQLLIGRLPSCQLFSIVC